MRRRRRKNGREKMHISEKGKRKGERGKEKKEEEGSIEKIGK